MTASFRSLVAHPELRKVTQLALPAVGNSLLQTLVFLVDRLMLGHSSEGALAAMQTAGPLVWSIYSLFGAYAVGTVAVVGRAVGAREPRDATSAARGSLLLGVVLGVLVGALGLLFLDPMLRAFGGGGGPAVRAISTRYLAVALPAMPAFFVGLTAISVLQAAGDTRTPFLIGLATNALNIVGNWFLVFGHGGAPALGATGSSISTALAAVLEAVLGVAALARASSPVSLRAVDGVSAWQGAVRVVQVAWGSWGERVVYHAGYLMYVSFVIGLGSVAMAANQALISVESISFLTADGFAVAAGALVAQALGAGDAHAARRAGWITAALASAVLGTCGLLFFAVPAPLIRAFRNDAAMAAMGAPALRVGALAQIPMAVGVVLAQSMRGAGATREALWVSLLGALVVRLAATWLFVGVLGLGLMGVWMGSTADWFVRAAVYSWRWRRGSWARAKV